MSLNNINLLKGGDNNDEDKFYSIVGYPYIKLQNGNILSYDGPDFCINKKSKTILTNIKYGPANNLNKNNIIYSIYTPSIKDEKLYFENFFMNKINNNLLDNELQSKINSLLNKININQNNIDDSYKNIINFIDIDYVNSFINSTIPVFNKKIPAILYLATSSKINEIGNLKRKFLIDQINNNKNLNPNNKKRLINLIKLEK